MKSRSGTAPFMTCCTPYQKKPSSHKLNECWNCQMLKNSVIETLRIRSRKGTGTPHIVTPALSWGKRRSKRVLLSIIQVNPQSTLVRSGQYFRGHDDGI